MICTLYCLPFVVSLPLVVNIFSSFLLIFHTSSHSVRTNSMCYSAFIFIFNNIVFFLLLSYNLYTKSLKKNGHHFLLMIISSKKWKRHDTWRFFSFSLYENVPRYMEYIHPTLQLSLDKSTRHLSTSSNVSENTISYLFNWNLDYFWIIYRHE
jgi:hypothetical protein